MFIGHLPSRLKKQKALLGFLRFLMGAITLTKINISLNHYTATTTAISATVFWSCVCIA